ncbi:MAG: DUF4252 domain-containing protein [Candidatus Korobacteraceae bacterium]
MDWLRNGDERGGAGSNPGPPPSQPLAAPPVQPAPPSQAPVVTPNQARAWVPEGIAALGQNASSRTEFTLDHSMLALASKLDKDEDLRRVIAGVNGVSVHSFRFQGAVSYDPAIMDSINQQYREAGWQHLVDKHKGDGGLTTDLWVHLDHASIRDIAVLLVGVKELHFVSVSGSITPLDLLHLSGHFGIPKMDGGVVVPGR